MNNWRRLLSMVLVPAAVLVGAACGDNDDDDSATPVSAPSVGSPSAQESVPLPEGAEPVPDQAQPGGEAYRIPDDIRLSDVDAFYTQQADGQPLQNYEWCGKVANARIWHRPGPDESTEDVLEVAPQEPTPGQVVVFINRRSEPPLSCPPEVPEGVGG